MNVKDLAFHFGLRNGNVENAVLELGLDLVLLAVIRKEALNACRRS